MAEFVQGSSAIERSFAVKLIMGGQIASPKKRNQPSKRPPRRAVRVWEFKMVPTRNQFTADELRVVCDYYTPIKAQRFLNALAYNHETIKETARSFRGVVKHQSAHCLEAAISAAVILEQQSYPPLLLDLDSQDGLGHVVFLYRKDGKWGTVGRSRDPGLHGRRPVFSTVRQVVASYAGPFVDLTGRITGFGVYDLNDLGNYNWRLSQRNVWRVERVLIEMQHQRFRMPQREYRYWYNRYVSFRERYPNRKPLYYPGRSTWKLGFTTRV